MATAAFEAAKAMRDRLDAEVTRTSAALHQLPVLQQADLPAAVLRHSGGILMPVLERTRERIVIIDPDAPLLTCTPADPFGIANQCPNNQTGHDFISACGDVVCCHCGKVVWS